MKRVFFLLLFLVCVGCGPRMAQVSGKITFNGEPVPAGSVMFAPQGEGLNVGRPAVGIPNAQGEFTLSSSKKDDGALVGKHLVTYGPPQSPEVSDPAKLAAEMILFKKFGKCRLPQGYTVEVQPGKNHFELNLTQ